MASTVAESAFERNEACHRRVRVRRISDRQMTCESDIIHPINPVSCICRISSRSPGRGVRRRFLRDLRPSRDELEVMLLLFGRAPLAIRSIALVIDAIGHQHSKRASQWSRAPEKS